MPNIRLLLTAIIRYPTIALWHLSGWKITRDLPDLKKYIIAGAPHTSNWDYMIFLLVVTQQRLRAKVTVKHTLFIPPASWFLRAFGGVPIERSQSHNFVDQLVNHFNESEEFVFIFAAEGTRSYRDYWKTGFYYTALKAGVPIVLAVPNYKTRVLNLDLVLEPTGDIEADFAIIREHVEKHGLGLHPEKASKVQPRPRNTTPETEKTA